MRKCFATLCAFSAVKSQTPMAYLRWVGSSDAAAVTVNATNSTASPSLHHRPYSAHSSSSSSSSHRSLQVRQQSPRPFCCCHFPPNPMDPLPSSSPFISLFLCFQCNAMHQQRLNGRRSNLCSSSSSSPPPPPPPPPPLPLHNPSSSSLTVKPTHPSHSLRLPIHSFSSPHFPPCFAARRPASSAAANCGNTENQ